MLSLRDITFIFDFCFLSTHPGPKGTALVVDRHTDPWSIVVLDTTRPHMPVKRVIMTGIRNVWGICYADTHDRKLIFVSSHRSRTLAAIDWKTGDTIWKVVQQPGEKWSPFNLCKSLKGCLFVNNMEKQWKEIYVYTYSGELVTTLRPEGIAGIMEAHCLSNKNNTFLVLGHLRQTRRHISIFELFINA